MNIDHIKTFLDVMETGNFNRTSERVAASQSTVSARIKALEDILDVSLFKRGRHGAIPTQSARVFEPHAQKLLRIWQQAKHELSLPKGYEGILRLSCQISLWNILMPSFIDDMRNLFPKVAVHLGADYSPTIVKKTADSLIDLGIVYRPDYEPDLTIENIGEEKFVMVSTDVKQIKDVKKERYIFIDWSPHFHVQHLNDYPEFHASPVTMDIGTMATSYFKEMGGTFYLPTHMIKHLQNTGLKLSPVEDATTISQPVYAIFMQDNKETPLIEAALSFLRGYIQEL